MKKFLFSVVTFSTLILVSCDKSETVKIVNPDFDLVSTSSQVIEGKYVVLFEDKGLLKSATVGKKVTSDEVRQAAFNIFNSVLLPRREPDLIYRSAIRGIAVEMTSDEAAKLSKADGVKGVYPDIMITLNLPSVQGKPRPTPPNETIPWGITRIGGSTSGADKTAWIIDTGIDLDHPDLNVNSAKGWNFIAGTLLADDDNGHGTHCAGIVAAKANTIGVVGVAAGASVVPIKVLNRRGSGAYSTIIAGVDFVAENAAPGDAANMSLGGPAYPALDAAVIALAEGGVNISLAAGNESDDANKYSPARANGANIYTVSAMDNADRWAYFSNYGNPPIEYCAPGVSIYSTYKGGAYATMSGTSMAAPHVCGLLLLGKISPDGNVIGDPDRIADPIAHN